MVKKETKVLFTYGVKIYIKNSPPLAGDSYAKMKNKNKLKVRFFFYLEPAPGRLLPFVLPITGRGFVLFFFQEFRILGNYKNPTEKKLKLNRLISLNN
jgi:hypothetical protein